MQARFELHFKRRLFQRLLIHDPDEKENNYSISKRPSYDIIPRSRPYTLCSWFSQQDCVLFDFSQLYEKRLEKRREGCNLFPREEEELSYSYRLGKHVQSQEKHVLAVRMFL